MREYKFRAWVKPVIEDGEVIYSGCMVDVLGIDFKRKKIIYYEPFDLLPMIGRKEELRFDEVELLQYTGLHDETDDEVEIYEGDIVKFSYKNKTYIGEVKFEAGTFILACNQLPDGYITMLDITNFDRDYHWIEGIVIGNVYDNLEFRTVNNAEIKIAEQ